MLRSLIKMEVKDEKSLKTAFYIRVSTEEQADKYGTKAQEAALEALVSSKGTFPDGRPKLIKPKPQFIYVDEISGTIPLEERPAFCRLQEDILNVPQSSPPFDVVLVYKLDRFARKLRILLDVLDFLEKYKLTFMSASESIDTNTPFGRAILGIVGVIAELEIETIKQRTHEGRTEAIKSGIYPSTPPYGYKKDASKRLEVFREEAAIVQRIYHEFVFIKKTPYLIAKSLADDRITIPLFSPKNKSIKTTSKNEAWFWREQTVRRILQDEIYIGKYYYGKSKDKKALPKEEWKLSPYEITSIIDPLNFSKAQELLLSYRSRISQQDSKDKRTMYLLRSLLKCDCCYDPTKDLHGRATWHGVRDKLDNGKFSLCYKCTRKNKTKTSHVCKALPLPAIEIENYVISFIINLISNPQIIFNYQEKLRSTQSEIKWLKNKESSLVEVINGCIKQADRAKYQHRHGIISSEELNKILAGLEKDIKACEISLLEVRKRLAQHNLSENYLKGFEFFKEAYIQMLKDTSTDREHLYNIIHSLIEEIVVKTRPIKPDDVIAGKKVVGQQIPHQLDIKLKLPQEFLYQLKQDATKRLNELSNQPVKTSIQPSKLNLKSSSNREESEVSERTW